MLGSIVGFIYFMREDPVEFLFTGFAYAGLFCLGLLTFSLTLIWG